MPSRYGPGVLPEPNLSFSSALSGLAGGVDYGMSLRERRRQQREEEEDRNRYLRALEAHERAQPGAMSLDEYLQGPEAKRAVNWDARKQSAPGAPLQFTPKAAARYYQTGTGAVVDREAARQQTLADMLARTIPSYAREGYVSPEARTQDILAQHPERGAAVKRTEATVGKDLAQRASQHQDYDAAVAAYPDLKGLSPATAVRLYQQRQGRDYQRTHPMPSRAGGARGTGGTRADPRVAALRDRARMTAQRVQQLENSPAAKKDDPLHQSWITELAAAWTANDTAQARYQRILQVAAPAPGSAPATVKAPQQWVDEVAAEPAWAHRPDAEIIREARRREAASRAPR